MKATSTGGKKSPSNENLPYVMLKTKFPFLYASTDQLWYKNITQSPRIVILKAVCRFVVLLLSTFSGFSIFGAGFSFAFNNFAHYCFVLLNAPLGDWDKKGDCNGLLFPVKSWSMVIDARRSRYPIELFGNLYELKSRIRFWEDYNNVERIYRMCRFDRFSSNFAKTF